MGGGGFLWLWSWAEKLKQIYSMSNGMWSAAHTHTRARGNDQLKQRGLLEPGHRYITTTNQWAWKLWPSSPAHLAGSILPHHYQHHSQHHQLWVIVSRDMLFIIVWKPEDCSVVCYLSNGRSRTTIKEVNGKSTAISEKSKQRLLLGIRGHSLTRFKSQTSFLQSSQGWVYNINDQYSFLP